MNIAIDDGVSNNRPHSRTAPSLATMARLGRPQTWVSKCELGERRVDFVELEDWAAACEKSLEWFGTRGKRP